MLKHLVTRGSAPRPRVPALVFQRLENPLGLPTMAKDIVKRHLLLAMLVGMVMTTFVPFAHADLYLSNRDTSKVLRYDEVTGAFIDTFVDSGIGGLDSARGLLLGPDGNLYVNSFNTNSVLRYDGTTGTPLPAPGKPDAIFVTPGDGGLQNPTGLILGRDGKLYVSSLSSDSVLRYSGTTGDFLDTFVPAGSGGLNNPRGLVFGPDGNLYVISTFGPGKVLRYDGTTGAPLPAPGQMDAVFVPGWTQAGPSLVFGPDGNLYVGDVADNSVVRFNGTTGEFMDTFVSPGSGCLNGPTGLIFGPDNNLYVESLNSNSLLRYDGMTGAFIDVFVPSGSGDLNHPAYLCFTNTDPTTLAYVPTPRSRFLITAPPTAVSGTPFDVTVTALDLSGNIDTNYQGTVTFSTTDPDPGVVLPGDYTFTNGDGGDNGVHTFPGGVTLITVGEHILRGTDMVSGSIGNANVPVSPGP